MKYFLEECVQGYSFHPPKLQTAQQVILSTRILHGIVSMKRCLDYNEFPSILPKDVKSDYFTKRTKNASSLPVHWMTSWKFGLILSVRNSEILSIL